jgi:hypothetical protein
MKKTLIILFVLCSLTTVAKKPKTIINITIQQSASMKDIEYLEDFKKLPKSKVDYQITIHKGTVKFSYNRRLKIRLYGLDRKERKQDENGDWLTTYLYNAKIDYGNLTQIGLRY